MVILQTFGSDRYLQRLDRRRHDEQTTMRILRKIYDWVMNMEE